MLPCTFGDAVTTRSGVASTRTPSRGATGRIGTCEPLGEQSEETEELSTRATCSTRQ